MDITSLSIEELQALKAQLDGLTPASGRSPFRERQLHDLTLLPTKDDPRPTFFWSADKPRNAGDLTKTAPYPRLMWEASTGKEITVASAKAQAEKEAEGYLLTPPANAEKPDAREMLRQQLESLSPEDRKVLAQAAQKDRLARIQEAMAALTEDEMAALFASVEPTKARKSA